MVVFSFEVFRAGYLKVDAAGGVFAHVVTMGASDYGISRRNNNISDAYRNSLYTITPSKK